MSKTSTQIDNEIEQMAEKMVKSVSDPKQLLFDTIMELGPEGLKKAAENLSEGEQALLKSCLEEMKKAQEDLTPKKTETKAADMKTEAQTGSDDEDEKLMNEKNAEHPHQGGPKDKPEGWDGQVIKSEDEDAMYRRELDKDGNPINVKVEKSESKAVQKLIEIEEAEHKTDIDGDGKVAEKLEKEKQMKKSLEEIVEMAKSLSMSKEDVLKAIKEANEDLELVKGKMKEMCDAKMAEKKEDAPAEEKKEEPKKMEKSVSWAPKNVLAANTLGRNTHYDVDAFIEKSESERAETLKKGEYLGETQGQELKKSKGKTDINDIIEKGMDYSTDEIKRIEGIRDHKVEGRVVKSFMDEDIARALGMSDEEYKKLMGE